MSMRGRSRLLKAFASGVALVGWTALTFAAGMVVVRPAPEVPNVAEYTEATATRGQLGQSLALNAKASWPVGENLHNKAVGTVTAVALTDAKVAEGEAIYAVNLRPVIVLSGNTPMFRDLGPGVRGQDVSQLEGALVRLGFLRGKPDELFDGATQAAVTRWQKKLEIDEPDGLVRVQDIIFSSSLPARMRLDEGMTIGSNLTGDEVIETLANAPSFTLDLTSQQANRLKTDQRVDLEIGGVAVESRVASLSQAPDSAEIQTATLASPADTPLCADGCPDLIPQPEPLLVPASVILTATTNGIIVPAGAITTSAAGATHVTNLAGEAVPVTVVASANGQAVVTGLADGDRVRVSTGASS